MTNPYIGINGTKIEFASNADGWTKVSDTFTYNAANKITVASGAALIYQKSDKLMFTQHGVVKKMYVLVVADTLLTVTGGTNNVVEDTATYPVTLPYYSHQENPLGFTHWLDITAPVFNLTTYDNGGGAQPTTSECRFKISGSEYNIHYRGNGTKAGTNNVISITSHSFITPVNTTTMTPIGVSHAYCAPWTVGVIIETFVSYFSADIADNAVVTHFGFTATYQI